jgi:branched-chain amino acid transport system substrate-binding protein
VVGGAGILDKEGRMKKALLLAGALVAALAGLSSAAAAPELYTAPSATPGVTSKTVTIGATFPLSGPVSPYATISRGMAAYFSYINARRGKDGKRGVYGRQIVFKVYDDQYNPAQTVQQTNRLILQDKVFALVGSLGTEPNLAIRPLTNQRKVPHLLVSTGASYWGTQYKQFPWTTGWQPDYVTEGKVYGQWILRNRPNAKVAVLYQNDDYGKDYLNGLKQGLGDKQGLIVSEQNYEVTDANYNSQIIRLRNSGADTWVVLSTVGRPTVTALATARGLNWRPEQIIINSVAATDATMAAVIQRTGAAFVNGSISTGYLKNPTNPKYRKDSAVRQYNQLLTKYGPSGANHGDTFYYYGMAKAYDFVKLLYAAGKNLTRESIMKATQNMNWTNPYTIKGVQVKTSATDRFPLDQVKIVRYTDGSWSEVSKLFKGR